MDKHLQLKYSIIQFTKIAPNCFIYVNILSFVWEIEPSLLLRKSSFSLHWIGLFWESEQNE